MENGGHQRNMGLQVIDFEPDVLADMSLYVSPFLFFEIIIIFFIDFKDFQKLPFAIRSIKIILVFVNDFPFVNVQSIFLMIFSATHEIRIIKIVD